MKHRLAPKQAAAAAVDYDDDKNGIDA